MKALKWIKSNSVNIRIQRRKKIIIDANIYEANRVAAKAKTKSIRL